jgi:anaerobic nitric oxide reductase flavorubredoxin
MPVEVAPNVYWVGAVDWNVRNFHGYTYQTHRGTSFNSYLIVDDHITLVDTVMQGFGEQMFRRIAEVVDPSRIEYVIANHGEPDHSGCIAEVMRRAPNATLFHSKRGSQTIGKYQPDGWPERIVGSGDTLSLGHKTLAFLEAPMLHWPDTMFTYVPEDRLLMPNDAFGQHLASATRFADEVEPAILWEEARNYFANILTPFSPLIIKKVEEVVKMGLQIDTIAPSHGVVWRKNPMQIIQKYVEWSSGDKQQARVVVVYETMWGATEEMARAIVEGLSQAGVVGQLLPVPQTDHTTVIGELLDSKGILIGSACHNRRPLLHISSIMEDVMGLKPVKKLGAAFGSYGWSSGAVQILEKGLQESGIEVAQPALATTWRPSPDDWNQAVAFGKAFGDKVKASVG